MGKRTRPDLVGLWLAVLCIVSMSLTMKLMTFIHTQQQNIASTPDGPTGFPRWLNIEDDTPVRMRVQESVRYDPSLPESHKEWNYFAPHGEGRVRTVDDQKLYYAAMFHQIHCVQLFATDVVLTDPSHWGHIRHCMNYLRTMALCKPDLTLEPGDFMRRNFTEDRQGAVHQCRDWKKVHEVLTKNYIDWYRVKANEGHRFTELAFPPEDQSGHNHHHHKVGGGIITSS